MRRLFLACALLALAAGSSPAYAERRGGVVALARFTCDYFIVYDNMGDYALLEWYGGWTPDQDDQLVGDWQQFGFVDIYDRTASASVHVWVEDYALSRASVARQFATHCST